MRTLHIRCTYCRTALPGPNPTVIAYTGQHFCSRSCADCWRKERNRRIAAEVVVLEARAGMEVR